MGDTKDVIRDLLTFSLCAPIDSMDARHFNQDGLLLNTEDIFTETTNILLARHKPGATLTMELKSKLMGMTAAEVSIYSTEGHGSGLAFMVNVISNNRAINSS